MLRQSLVKNGSKLLQTQARNFAIVTPPSKMHFIDHPRHGKVYPVACYDFSKQYYTLPIASFCGLTAVNSIVLYGTFVQQIFTPLAAGFLCNPVFLVPSLWINYTMH